MKKRVQQTAGVLLALTVMAAVTACNGKTSGTSAGGQTAAEVRDLNGFTITIGNWWADWDVNTREANSTSEQQLIDYRKKIQQDGNFTMTEKNISSWDNMAEFAATSILSGTAAASVIILQPNWALALYNQGLLYPVSDAKSVDFSVTTPVPWTKSVLDAFTFGGKAYAFSPEGTGGSQHESGVYFNKRLFEEAGINPDTPYDMQKAGTWTWDAFLDICKKLTRDTNNDGIIDTYALATLSTETLDAIVASNGANYVGKDASGKLVNATGTPEFLEALQYSVRLNTEGVLMPQPANSNWDWFKAAFHDGQAAMRVDETYVGQELRDMVDDWGYVFFPKGPRASDYITVSDENVFIIPGTVSAEDAEKIMYAVKLWYTPIDTRPDAWKDTLYNIYRDERAVNETRTMMRDPNYGTWKYVTSIPGLERGDIAWNMWNEGQDPAQLVESVSQNWNYTIGEANPK
jgi:ABC-type glycerol-3-phosphate transport system substrate-binding protein